MNLICVLWFLNVPRGFVFIRQFMNNFHCTKNKQFLFAMEVKTRWMVSLDGGTCLLWLSQFPYMVFIHV